MLCQQVCYKVNKYCLKMQDWSIYYRPKVGLNSTALQNTALYYAALYCVALYDAAVQQ